MKLDVLIGGRLAGHLNLGDYRRPKFDYHRAYTGADAIALSVQFPVSAGGAEGERLRWWLQGLLPDDRRALHRLMDEYGCDGDDPLALLGTPMGSDCAGAVQFCPPESTQRLLARQGGHTDLSDQQVAEWMARLLADPAYRPEAATGQGSGFSLAGMQPKIALAARDHGGWSVPWGAAPTTHILKAARHPVFPHEAAMEHATMAAASRMGILAARTRLEVYGETEVIVVERFDRVQKPGGGLVRIHQEDLCQALGIAPDRKYQREGGPSPEAIARLLHRLDPAGQPTSVERFRDMLLFLWLTASTDGHAKNYSILHAPAQARLAPLYDVCSWLPYRSTEPIAKISLSMKIGKNYRLSAADRASALLLTAERLGLPGQQTAQRAVELAESAPAAFEAAVDSLPPALAASEQAHTLIQDIASRVRKCRQVAQEAACQGSVRGLSGVCQEFCVSGVI